MRQNRIARVVLQSSIGAEARHGLGFVDGLAGIEQCLGAAREETGTALLHPRLRLVDDQSADGPRRAARRAANHHPATGCADAVGRPA